MANDFIVSASSDGTCRLWDSSSGACLREIQDGSNAQTLCCRFHPHNNNILVVSNPTISHVYGTQVLILVCVHTQLSDLAHHALCIYLPDLAHQLGNSKAQVKVFNVSTGKSVKGGSNKTAGAALCLAFDSTGSKLWVGDSKVTIFAFGLLVVSKPL